MKKIFSVRTDIAAENCEMLREQKQEFGDGIKFSEEKNDIFSSVTVDILNEEGEKKLGRKIGRYITVESEKLRKNDASCHEAVTKEISRVLMEIDSFKNAKSILAVGLGNRNITPDALGPKVIDRLLVTRHIMEDIPEELEKGVRMLSALAPGVMGITGIETFEIIKGVTEKIKPDIIVAIDALAARKFSRINSTVQISNCGVAPGAGVGNKREELSEKTLGIPVIVIGVPTVVDGATLVNDTMDKILFEMKNQSESGSEFYEMILSLENEEKYELIRELLTPYEENMFVTPKEVDMVIDRLADIIANAINTAVHPAVKMEDVKKYSW